MRRISHQVSMDLKRAFISLLFMVDKGRLELPTPETYRVTADWGYQFSNSSIFNNHSTYLAKLPLGTYQKSGTFCETYTETKYQKPHWG